MFFSRGGKDSTIELWNDIQFVSDLLALNVPFYTAIGHSDLITLAEKFSDESFTTPGGLLKGTRRRLLLKYWIVRIALLAFFTQLNPHII